jgi:hypothetical protein
MHLPAPRRTDSSSDPAAWNAPSRIAVYPAGAGTPSLLSSVLVAQFLGECHYFLYRPPEALGGDNHGRREIRALCQVVGCRPAEAEQVPYLLTAYQPVRLRDTVAADRFSGHDDPGASEDNEDRLYLGPLEENNVCATRPCGRLGILNGIQRLGDVGENVRWQRLIHI